jgi:sugar lactone lactonase YvrE
LNCPADTRIRYDSRNDSWKRWHLPGDRPQPYAVYVDDTDAVWVSDWGANAILRFDPKTERFESFPLPDSYANVRQLAGRMIGGLAYGPTDGGWAFAHQFAQPDHRRAVFTFVAAETPSNLVAGYSDLSRGLLCR